MKLLLIDDSYDILEMLAEEFETTDYEIILGESGNQAIEILKTNEVDAIISDFNMPNGSGLEVLNFIKTLKPRQLFIFLTAQVDYTLNECLAFGADKYISKPFCTIEVHSELRKILNQKVELL